MFNTLHFTWNFWKIAARLARLAVSGGPPQARAAQRLPRRDQPLRGATPSGAAGRTRDNNQRSENCDRPILHKDFREISLIVMQEVSKFWHNWTYSDIVVAFSLKYLNSTWGSSLKLWIWTWKHRNWKERFWESADPQICTHAMIGEEVENVALMPELASNSSALWDDASLGVSAQLLVEWAARWKLRLKIKSTMENYQRKLYRFFRKVIKSSYNSY